MKKIVFFYPKGGTGKTTLCYNYGWYLASKLGKKVLFLDFDPQINLVKAFDKTPALSSKNTFENLLVRCLRNEPVSLKKYLVRINDHIDLLPSSNNISQIEEHLTNYLLDRLYSEKRVYTAKHRNLLLLTILDDIIQGDYDFVLIDSPSNYSFLSTTAMIYAQNIIAVSRPDFFSYIDIEYLLKILKNLKSKFDIDVKILCTVMNALERRRIVPELVLDHFEKEYKTKINILDNKLRYLSQYQYSIILERQPVFMSYPTSDAARDLINTFQEIQPYVDGLPADHKKFINQIKT